MKTSLILTVLNEADSLPTLLDSVAMQTVLPDEVVICDGGSYDNTVALLRAETRFPIRVIESHGANISRGRNLAIAAAQNEIIAVTDAGVRLDERWMERLCEVWSEERGAWGEGRGARGEGRGTWSEGRGASDASRPTPLALRSSPLAAAGLFLPDPHTTFEIAMSATVLPALNEIKPETFLPSSRSVAFLKSAWTEVGGYPEWLDYCEDLIFDLNLRKQCGPFAFAPEAIAYFRPRGSLRSFYKQYYLYARGDGKANLFFKRHMIRYATYLVALPILIGLIAVTSGWLPFLAMIALLVGAAVYLKSPYQRLGPLMQNAPLTLPERLNAIALVPVIRMVGDIAKMIGYPVGVLWRWKRVL